MRYADDGRFEDIGMLVQSAFHLDRVDVVATANEHVLRAVDDVQETVDVETAEVTAVHPAVLPSSRGGFRVVEVTALTGRYMQQDLADFSDSDVVAGLVDDPDAHARQWLADRSRPASCLSRRQHADAPACLGQAVAVEQDGVGQRLRQSID